MKVAEFCAGYNGLGMAVEAVFGAEPGWFSEYDTAPSKILAHHYPDVRNYGDMTKIKWAPDCPKCGNMCSVHRHEDDSPYYWCGLCGVDWDISIRLDDPDAEIIPEPADIHSGGTPCQDLSAAGRRAGMNEGTRSNLWANMREAIAIQRPKYVVWENVRGAFSACASSEMGQCPGCVDGRGPHKPFLRALGRVLGDLSDLGYDTQWRGLRAADVGACHGRFRVFVLARRSDARDTDLAHVEGGGAAGWADADSEQSPRPYRSTSDGYRTQGSSDSDSCTRGRGPDTGNTSGGAAEVQDPPHADSVGHERPRDARGRWTRLANGGQPLADTEGIGRGEGWTESTGILRRLSTTSDSALASDAGCVTVRQHSGEPPAEEAGPRDCDGPCNPRGEQHVGDRREALADSKGRGRGVRESIYLGQAGGEVDTSGDDSAPPGREAGAPTNWGDYEPAIRRWERTIGRPAPRPTEPTGRNGGHRLSPRFTEWMMGLPDGWVTDPAIGISRNDQLKACGNGVVPQQAYAALSNMLAAFKRNTEGIRRTA